MRSRFDDGGHGVRGGVIEKKDSEIGGENRSKSECDLGRGRQDEKEG